MKNLSNLADRKAITERVAELTPDDAARWGSMNVRQMICHLDDAYKVALGLKTASSASSLIQRTLVKWVALRVPMQWPKGIPTLPEVEQGKGGTLPSDFRQDVQSLLASLGGFCEELPRPLPVHAMFGMMTLQEWMRWGYLHADHHLRQFGR